MNWRVTVANAPTKFLERLRDRTLKARLIEAINDLRTDPHPNGSVKLHGSENLFRVRVSDYRIIYQVQGKLLTVLVVEIGHRREVYR